MASTTTPLVWEPDLMIFVPVYKSAGSSSKLSLG